MLFKYGGKERGTTLSESYSLSCGAVFSVCCRRLFWPLCLYLQKKKAIKLSTFTVYCTVFQLFNLETGKQWFTEISFYCRAFVPVVFEFLPYPKLRVSCLAQSHLSSLCIPCVKVQVWWGLPEDGHQLLSHKPPMQTLVEKNNYYKNIKHNIYMQSPSLE